MTLTSGADGSLGFTKVASSSFANMS